MAGAFERAVEWIRREIENGRPISTIMLTMPTFKDDELTINKIYSFDPLIIGYADPEMKIELDSKLILRVDWIAKNLGLWMVVTPPEIHILRESEPVGLVRRNGFGASDPVLYSELFRQIGPGKSQLETSVEVKDSWIKSIKALLTNQQFRRFLSAVLGFVILPTALVSSISLTYPSLLGGGLTALLMPIIVFIATAIITYLYLRRSPAISSVNKKSIYNDTSGGRVKGE